MLQSKLHSSSRPYLYGTCVLSPSPHFIQVAKACSLDFVFLDTEHIPLDRHQLSWMCRAYAEANVPCIVRVPSVVDASGGATQVLDGGAAGVVAPYIETVEQVLTLVGQCKLRPLKGSLLEACKDRLRTVALETVSTPQTSYNNPLQHLTDVLPAETIAFMNSSNQSNNLLFINIESQAGIMNLPQLLNVPGIDGVFVGPKDLSVNFGVPCQWDSKVFLEACDTIVVECAKRGLSVANHYSFKNAIAYQKRWRALGANMCIHMTDMKLFQKALSQDLEEIRGGAASSTRIDNVVEKVDDV